MEKQENINTLCLMFKMKGKYFSRQHYDIFFFLFSQIIEFDKVYFLIKIRKNIITLLCAELAQRVVKVKKTKKKKKQECFEFTVFNLITTLCA